MLSQSLQSVIEPQLKNNEKILWTAQPDPMRAALQPYVIVMLLLGVICICMSIPTHSFIGSLPFYLIGAVMLLYPVYTYWMALKTVYAITTDHIFIIVLRGTRYVDTYGQSDLADIKSMERADKSGNLIFARKKFTNSQGQPRDTVVQFVAIPSVRAVEALLRETFPT